MRVERQTILCIAMAASWTTLAVISLTGCNRAYYREQADREVATLVAEKSNDPRWSLPGYDIGMNPRSRYYDPYSIDCPPMPEDDPSSHEYMHALAGMKHYAHWHQDGERPELENPQWRQLLGEYVELNERGEVKLTLEGAMRLALTHAPDYRAQIESLYLSALDVSTERFRLDTQFFLTNNTAYIHKGEDRPPTGETNLLTTDTNATIRRRFATGAELLVGFANSFVWQFAGPDTNFTTSLINFNLVQPLLRAGGRVIALEQLTIVERALLANLRAFQRYRQGFYTNVAIGDGGVAGVQRRGGFFGGTGLTGFTGQGSGGFGGVGAATFGGGGGGFGGGGGGGGAGFAGGGAGTVGGFIGLLQQLQQVRNTQDNLNAEIRTLGLLEANLDAGLIDIAQVDQFRQSIETERANLLQAQNSLRNSLDTFKTTAMGLPPHLEIELDDSLIRQFQFIDPRGTSLQNEVEDLVVDLGDLPNTPRRVDLREALARLHAAQKRLVKQFENVTADLESLEAAAERRQRYQLADETRQFDEDRKRMNENLDELRGQLGKLGETIIAFDAKLDTMPEPAATDELVSLVKELSNISQEASLVQARARVEAVTLDRVKMSPSRALQIARANRLDWMNNRASLVDTWRLIAFNANALKSNVDITFSGDLGTEGNNPVKFQGANGTLRAGLRFDAPFTRLLERNNYRSVLISYQQDRRRLIQYEDLVHQTLRRILRQLDQLSQNLEIQRRAVTIATRRVDQTREVLNKPPEPVKPGQPATQLGPTAAQNLLTALSDLRNSQNNFMSVWLNYYATRMVLLRELGIMEIDENGLWVDFSLDQWQGSADDGCPLPPEIPIDWLEKAGVKPHELESVPPGKPMAPLSPTAVQPSPTPAMGTAALSPERQPLPRHLEPNAHVGDGVRQATFLEPARLDDINRPADEKPRGESIKPQRLPSP